MYLRTFKQFLRSLQPQFDERQFGFSSTYELARQAHRDGLLRVERNRQGILRIYPAERFPRIAPEQPIEEPAPIEAAEPGIEILSPEPAIPESVPEQLSPPESAAPFAEIQVEIAEPASEPEETAGAVQPEVIAEIIGEQAAPKQKPKRGKRTSSHRTKRPGKSRARSTKE
jgi:hypothetical protein